MSDATHCTSCAELLAALRQIQEIFDAATTDAAAVDAALDVLDQVLGEKK